ncbi:MAG: hypothetical protein NTX56_04115 [Proteobacteria bacterium]|nr:hypothetical protein [Pseudomonadota bacterium]
MSRRSRSRQVEIFNFSFLDILACTIALLIFIMVMVFILQTNSPIADEGAIAEVKLRQVVALQSATTFNTQMAESLEAMFDQVRAPDEPDLTPQRDAAKVTRNRASISYNEILLRVQSAQARLDDLRMARERAAAELERARTDLNAARERQRRAEADLNSTPATTDSNNIVLSPYRRPGDPAEAALRILHVDCRPDGVVLLIKGEADKIDEAGRTNLDDLGEERAAYKRLVGTHLRQPGGMILFWIRPSANDTFASALRQLPSGTPYGFEPADADWSFRQFKSP